MNRMLPINLSVRKVMFWTGLILLVSFVVMSARVEASSDNPIKITFNEQDMELAKDPINMKGTTLVPFRPLFEAMGMKVTWNQEHKTITATSDDYELKMQVGSKQANVNGSSMTLSEAPRVVDGHTLVPIRFISESTGALVFWNPYGPQVIVYTDDFMEAHGVTSEQVTEAINEELARIRSEYEEANKPIPPVKVPAAFKGSGIYKPATSDSINLKSLQGMYYGFRADLNGYECGGICWDLYTFLPDSKVVVGLPENGGPETIDCKVDQCHSYTIKDGKLRLTNGDSFPIEVEKGVLVINELHMSRVKTASNDLRLDNYYEHIGYSGLIGITPVSSSWTYSIDFNKDSTFKSSRNMIGRVEGGAPTTGASADNTTGSYRITGNTLVLAYQDGTVVHRLFFIHEDGDIQIGNDHYSVPD